MHDAHRRLPGRVSLHLMSPHFPVPAIHSNKISIQFRAYIPTSCRPRHGEHRRTRSRSRRRDVPGAVYTTGQPARQGLTRKTPGTSSCGPVVRLLSVRRLARFPGRLMPGVVGGEIRLMPGVVGGESRRLPGVVGGENRRRSLAGKADRAGAGMRGRAGWWAGENRRILTTTREVDRERDGHRDTRRGRRRAGPRGG